MKVGFILITTVIESLAEAMALIRKSGIDQNVFLEFLPGSPNAPSTARRDGNRGCMTAIAASVGRVRAAYLFGLGSQTR